MYIRFCRQLYLKILVSSPAQSPSPGFSLWPHFRGKGWKTTSGQKCPEVRYYPDSARAVLSDLESTSMEKVPPLCSYKSPLRPDNGQGYHFLIQQTPREDRIPQIKC